MCDRILIFMPKRSYFIVPAEPEDVNCRFTDRCACGYQALSANIYNQWMRVPKLSTETTKTNSTNGTQEEEGNQ